MLESLTIVGAGPVGMLLALTLANRGYDVDIYEGRPDVRHGRSEGGRSINLALARRGIHALEAIGLDREVLRDSVRMHGRMIHHGASPPSFLPYGRDDSEVLFSMVRDDLHRKLIARAEATGRIRIHFHRRLVRYCFESQRATFRDEATGSHHVVDAPILFGTDGSRSALRAAIVEKTGGESRYDEFATGYKELSIPALLNGRGVGPDGRFALDPHGLHIWPRQRFMLIALPNLDGSFTCIVFLDLESPDALPSFARLRDEAAAADFFERYFPDFVRLVPSAAADFMAAPLGRMVTVKTSPWHYGGVLLLGDAAHAMVPFLGQGMNAGFEDCTLLGRLLDTQPPDSAASWSSLYETFARARKVDTDAVATLAIENYAELRAGVSDPRFILEKAVEAELCVRYPGQYRSRYQLIAFTLVPYHVAQEAGRIQHRILSEVCAGVERAEQVDYSRAQQLIAEHLRPLLSRHGL